MKPQTWQTNITRIRENEILVKGYPIEDLMGQRSFAETFYLLIKGELPTRNIARVLDAILISSVDHGVTPPSCQTAILSASTGAALNGALAAGILSINEFHGGAIADSMRLLKSAINLMKTTSMSVPDAAAAIVDDHLTHRKKLMGYGHRVHSNDPRTQKLFDIATENGVAGVHVAMCLAIRDALQERGKSLPVNVDAAIAALLCELDFPETLANAFFIISRLPGLVAHILEEKSRYKPMRKIDFAMAEYDGPEKRQIPDTEE